ncbi:MAG: hypothetical protein JXA93_03320 [Anaerolineae bacterium]|nr:hypothetical protein [Anaerolineae bacterium]
MIYSSVPATLMRVLTEREGLPPLPSTQTWRERWQWWTDRPPTPETAPAPAPRELNAFEARLGSFEIGGRDSVSRRANDVGARVDRQERCGAVA